jgi:hypothetical protein
MSWEEHDAATAEISCSRRIEGHGLDTILVPG